MGRRMRTAQPRRLPSRALRSKFQAENQVWPRSLARPAGECGELRRDGERIERLVDEPGGASLAQLAARGVGRQRGEKDDGDAGGARVALEQAARGGAVEI